MQARAGTAGPVLARRQGSLWPPRSRHSRLFWRVHKRQSISCLQVITPADGGLSRLSGSGSTSGNPANRPAAVVRLLFLVDPDAVDGLAFCVHSFGCQRHNLAIGRESVGGSEQQFPVLFALSDESVAFAFYGYCVRIERGGGVIGAIFAVRRGVK